MSWYGKGVIVYDHARKPLTGSIEEYNVVKHFVNGYLSRLDGPAIVSYTDGWKDNCTWYLCGKKLGDGQKGFWKLWSLLSKEEQADYNLQLWLAAYMGINVQAD